MSNLPKWPDPPPPMTPELYDYIEELTAQLKAARESIAQMQTAGGVACKRVNGEWVPIAREG